MKFKTFLKCIGSVLACVIVGIISIVLTGHNLMESTFGVPEYIWMFILCLGLGLVVSSYVIITEEDAKH